MSERVFTKRDMFEAYEAGRMHGYYNPEDKEEYREMRKHEGYASFDEWLKKHELSEETK